MNQSKSMRVWNIIYPVAIYYVVTTLTLFVLDFSLPETADSKLLRQLITSLVAIPFMYSFYRPDQMMRGKVKKGKFQLSRWKSKESFDNVKLFVVMFFIGGCFAVAWNNILGMLHIVEYSDSYGQVVETFYTGRLLLEITALCIVIPFVEELLYRGIVYGRIRDWLGVKTAIVASAIFFGVIHMNLVQFVYATVFGLLLAWFAEKTNGIYGAVAAHMAANLTSVLRAETKVFVFMDESMPIQVVVTIVLLIVVGAGVWKIYRNN